MVKTYEYETGFYEYTDSEGNLRIGKWEQKYEVYKGFYGGKKVRGKKVGVVDFNPDEDSDEYVGGVPDKRRECPHCLELDVHSKLGPRTFKDNEPIPEDNDLFLQCYVCWN